MGKMLASVLMMMLAGVVMVMLVRLVMIMARLSLEMVERGSSAHEKC